jgi:hypothetical protein
MTLSKTFSRPLLYSLMAVTMAVALQYSANADAHGRRGGFGIGWFAGGLVVGAALAPRYAYPAPVYYYSPPTYYAPPPVVYTQPPIVYAQPPIVYTQPPIVVQPAPAVVTAPQQTQVQPSTVEDRLRRLRSLCEQGLLTPQECQNRREEVLREL